MVRTILEHLVGAVGVASDPTWCTLHAAVSRAPSACCAYNAALCARYASPMKLIIKFFPEITIKSRQVRKRFVAQLKGNLKKVLSAVDPQARVNGNWDSLEVNLGQVCR